ncbi:MAG: flagellar biosynthetic protein FliO [Magnetococcus sp. DMHC-8]
MTRSGVVARFWVVWFAWVVVVGLAGAPVVQAVEARVTSTDGKAAPPDGRAAPADGKAVSVESKTLPADGRGGATDTRIALSVDMLTENPWVWKVSAALLVLVVVAVLVVRMGKRFRTQWRGAGPIFIEDGRNLAPGVGVRLIRVGARYWLIGVTRENITLLAELTEDDLLEEELAAEEEPAVDLVLPKGRSGRGVHGDEPSLVDRGLRR